MVKLPNVRLDRRLGSALLLLALASGAACAGDPVVIEQSEDPFLYLVLGERTQDRRWFGNVHQHALLLTVGSPAEPPEYRPAERFEMRRLSDGAAFAWEAYPALGEIGSYPDARMDEPSHYLPDSPADGRLGAADLSPGETYELEVETLGVLITGRVTMPGAIRVEIVQEGDRSIAAWAPVNGAGGYRVLRNDDAVVLQADTVHPIPREMESGGWIEVQALSPELYAYMLDPQATRAGLDQGYGIFGAVTSTRLTY